MKTRTAIFATIILISIAGTGEAGTFRPGFRLLAGYCSLSMDDLNNSLDRWNESLAEAGVPGTVSKHISDAVWGVDMALEISPRFVILLSYDRTPSNTDDRLPAGDGFFRVQRNVDGRFITAGALLYPKATWPTYITVRVGWGFGHATERYEGYPNPSRYQVNRFGYDIDGMAVVEEFGLGATIPLTPKRRVASAFIEGSYRARRLGVFDGTGFINRQHMIGELRDDLGQPIKFDWSGFAIKAGIEIFFNVSGYGVAEE